MTWCSDCKDVQWEMGEQAARDKERKTEIGEETRE